MLITVYLAFAIVPLIPLLSIPAPEGARRCIDRLEFTKAANAVMRVRLAARGGRRSLRSWSTTPRRNIGPSPPLAIWGPFPADFYNVTKAQAPAFTVDVLATRWGVGPVPSSVVLVTPPTVLSLPPTSPKPISAWLRSPTCPATLRPAAPSLVVASPTVIPLAFLHPTCPVHFTSLVIANPPMDNSSVFRPAIQYITPVKVTLCIWAVLVIVTYFVVLAKLKKGSQDPSATVVVPVRRSAPLPHVLMVEDASIVPPAPIGTTDSAIEDIMSFACPQLEDALAMDPAAIANDIARLLGALFPGALDGDDSDDEDDDADVVDLARQIFASVSSVQKASVSVHPERDLMDEFALDMEAYLLESSKDKVDISTHAVEEFDDPDYMPLPSHRTPPERDLMDEFALDVEAYLVESGQARVEEFPDPDYMPLPPHRTPPERDLMDEFALDVEAHLADSGQARVEEFPDPDYMLLPSHEPSLVDVLLPDPDELDKVWLLPIIKWLEANEEFVQKSILPEDVDIGDTFIRLTLFMRDMFFLPCFAQYLEDQKKPPAAQVLGVLADISNKPETPAPKDVAPEVVAGHLSPVEPLGQRTGKKTHKPARKKGRRRA